MYIFLKFQQLQLIYVIKINIIINVYNDIIYLFLRKERNVEISHPVVETNGIL